MSPACSRTLKPDPGAEGFGPNDGSFRITASAEDTKHQQQLQREEEAAPSLETHEQQAAPLEGTSALQQLQQQLLLQPHLWRQHLTQLAAHAAASAQLLFSAANAVNLLVQQPTHPVGQAAITAQRAPSPAQDSSRSKCIESAEDNRDSSELLQAADTLRGIDSPSPRDEVTEDFALDVDAVDELPRQAHEQGDIREDAVDMDGSQPPAPSSPAEMETWRVNCIAAHKELTEKNTLKLLDTQQIIDKFLRGLICPDADVAEKIDDVFRMHLSITRKGYQKRLDAILKVVKTNTPGMTDGDNDEHDSDVVVDIIDLTGDDIESTDTAVAVPDSDHDHAATEDGNASNASSKKRHPNAYHCTKCHKTGHNRRTCPLLARVVLHNSIGDPGAQAPAPTGVVRTAGSVEVTPTEEGRRGATIVTPSVEVGGRNVTFSAAQARSAAEPALPAESPIVRRPGEGGHFINPKIYPTPQPIATDPRPNWKRRRLQAINEQETDDSNRLDHAKSGEGRENACPRDETSDRPNRSHHKTARITAPAQTTAVPVREHFRSKFLEAMRTVQDDASYGPAPDESELAPIAMEVEKQLYLFHTDSKWYSYKALSLVFNLKNNHDLRANVISGNLPADELVRMLPPELANKDLQAMRAKREAMIGEDAFLPEPAETRADPQKGIDLERQHWEALQK